MWIYLNLGLYKYFEEMVSRNHLILLHSSIDNSNHDEMRFSFLYDMYGNLINVWSRNIDFHHVITEFKYYTYEYFN
jgi:hypothetical protein